MEANHIYPQDIQMLVLPNGSWKLIDLEWYLPHSEIKDRFLSEAEDYEKNKQIILNYFEQHLELSPDVLN
jgi:hypothetical protein